jgi:hypothetical protein
MWTAPVGPGSGADLPPKCQLQSDTPLNFYQAGVTSGLKGSWVSEGASAECLTLVRSGAGPMHGNVSVCASSSDGSAKFRAITGDTAEQVFDAFAAGGGAGGNTPLTGL